MEDYCLYSAELSLSLGTLVWCDLHKLTWQGGIAEVRTVELPVNTRAVQLFEVIEDRECCYIPAMRDQLCLLHLLLAAPAATKSLCSHPPLVWIAGSAARPARRPQCAYTGQSWLAGWRHHTDTARWLPLLPHPAVPSAEHACLG